MKMIMWLILLTVYLVPSCKMKNMHTAGQCEPARLLSKVKNIEVKQLEYSNALIFESGMLVDADGSPRAYHPEDIGLDALHHAGGEDGHMEGIVYINGKPLIQGPKDPAPGYYVSQTSLEDKSRNITDPRRYVNAEEVPYIVLPASVARQAGIKLGDIALVLNKKNDWYAYAIYADTGPEGIIGEGSMALAESLDIDHNPRHGGVQEGIIYVVFPNSGNEGPLDKQQIDKRGRKAAEDLGGLDKIIKCIKAN